MTDTRRALFRPGTRAALIGCAWALTACADLSGLSKPLAVEDKLERLAPQPPSSPATIASDWWRDLGDRELNRLMDHALQDNPQLALAQARWRMALSALQGAQDLDQVHMQAQADAVHQRFTARGLYPPPLAGSVQDSATVQLAGAWEPDFFGRNQAALQAALGQSRAAQADALAARSYLTHALAQQYVDWAQLQAQDDVLQTQQALLQDLITRIGQRLNAGVDTQMALEQSRSDLAQLARTRAGVREQVQRTRHALSALSGVAETGLSQRAGALSGLQLASTAEHIPMDLLGRRADIAAARWRVEAAGQGVSQVRAQFYPNINLAGFVGLSSIGLGQLAQAGSLQWGVGPALRLPVFNTDALRAQLSGQNAALDAAVASYNAAVRQAVRETADQLGDLQAVHDQQRAQSAQAAASASLLASAQARFDAGLADYLVVLRARLAVLAQQGQAAELNARHLHSQIALIHALGGGYTPSTQDHAP